VNTDSTYEWRRQLVWGIIIIVIGVTLVLDRMEIVEVDEIWHYWPLLLVVLGMNKMVGYPTARHFTNGLWLMFLGLWLFAVVEHLYGLTLHNSWPFVIIALGVKIVIEPFIKARFAPHSEIRNEK